MSNTKLKNEDGNRSAALFLSMLVHGAIVVALVFGAAKYLENNSSAKTETATQTESQEDLPQSVTLRSANNSNNQNAAN
jgi:hypothetical protein